MILGLSTVIRICSTRTALRIVSSNQIESKTANQRTNSGHEFETQFKKAIEGFAQQTQNNTGNAHILSCYFKKRLKSEKIQNHKNYNQGGPFR